VPRTAVRRHGSTTKMVLRLAVPNDKPLVGWNIFPTFSPRIELQNQQCTNYYQKPWKWDSGRTTV
jgi:hypothetical protein